MLAWLLVKRVLLLGFLCGARNEVDTNDCFTIGFLLIPMGKLDFYIHPRSVAVIGASTIEGKVGHSIMKNIIKSGYKDKLFPINPKPGKILDYECYKSVMDVPDPIDVAVICIPAKFVAGAAEECGKKGIKGIIVVAAGFREVGGVGIELENHLYEVCKQYNLRCIGPNVLGNITTSINMSFAAKTPRRGKIAMLSQSGAMMTAVLDWADAQQIGFSHFISLGNKIDVDEVDFIEEISDDPDTTILILYLESVNDGEKFMRIVRKATTKKPVIILKSGTSPAGKSAATSHTGALSGDDVGFDLAFEKAGVIRARSMNELFDIANLFDKARTPLGNKFAIVTNAGGPGIIATDAFSDSSISFAQFTPECNARLRDVLPSEASTKNPVDIVGDAPPRRFHDALTAIFQEPVDVCAGAVVLVTPQSTTNPSEVANVLIQVHNDFPNHVMVTAFMGGDTMNEPRKILESNSIPCYPFPEPAIKALRELIRYKTLVVDNRYEEERFEFDNEAINNIIKTVKNEGRKMLTPNESNKIMKCLDIYHPPEQLVTTVEEVLESFKEFTKPIALKIVSPDIQHKTEYGGVKLNINTENEAVDAFNEIINSIKTKLPDAKILGCEMQSMLSASDHEKRNEIIIGMNRDPQWGPLLMFGTGGIYANYIKDVSFRLATRYTNQESLEQIKETKIYSILSGVRGEKPSDIPALIDVLKKLAQFAVDFTDVVEFDINPIIVYEEGAGVCALDLKIMV